MIALTILYQSDKRPTSQSEALFDEGLHRTAALVGSLALFNMSTKQWLPKQKSMFGNYHIHKDNPLGHIDKELLKLNVDHVHTYDERDGVDYDTYGWKSKMATNFFYFF